VAERLVVISHTMTEGGTRERSVKVRYTMWCGKCESCESVEKIVISLAEANSGLSEVQVTCEGQEVYMAYVRFKGSDGNQLTRKLIKCLHVRQ